MKLNDTTLQVLKNFATINHNLVIKQGKKISTINASRDVFATFTGEDEFDKDVAIFNLTEFLGVLGAFDSPELVLSDKEMTIKKGKAKVNYTYADVELLITPPAKEIKFPTADVELSLPENIISKMLKMCAILSVEDIAIVGDGETISIKVFDKKNPTSNAFDEDLEIETDKVFQANFKIDRFKLLPGDYDVQISSKGVSLFTNKDIKITYMMGLEKDSEF